MGLEQELEQIHRDQDREVYIFNPTGEDFTHTYDTNHDGHPLSYTIRARESEKFPKVIAEHLAKHLKDRIVGQMPGVITDTIIDKVYKDIKMYE